MAARSEQGMTGTGEERKEERAIVGAQTVIGVVSGGWGATVVSDKGVFLQSCKNSLQFYSHKSQNTFND